MTTTSSAPASFQILDYTLQEKIGVGSFATVFRAEKTPSSSGNGRKIMIDVYCLLIDSGFSVFFLSFF